MMNAQRQGLDQILEMQDHLYGVYFQHYWVLVLITLALNLAALSWFVYMAIWVRRIDKNLSEMMLIAWRLERAHEIKGNLTPRPADPEARYGPIGPTSRP